MLYPLAGGEPKAVPNQTGRKRRIVRFEPDGKSVLVAQRGVPDQDFPRLPRRGRREEIREITPPDPAGVMAVMAIRFSADDKSYAYSYFRVMSDLWVVDGLK